MCMMCQIAGRNLHEEQQPNPHENESHYDRLVRMKAHYEARLASINQLMTLMENNPDIKLFLEIEDNLRKEN